MNSLTEHVKTRVVVCRAANILHSTRYTCYYFIYQIKLPGHILLNTRHLSTFLISSACDRNPTDTSPRSSPPLRLSPYASVEIKSIQQVTACCCPHHPTHPSTTSHKHSGWKHGWLNRINTSWHFSKPRPRAARDSRTKAVDQRPQLH